LLRSKLHNPIFEQADVLPPHEKLITRGRGRGAPHLDERERESSSLVSLILALRSCVTL